ncbi:MAG: hypothetical protein LBB17_02230 [Puniceicoccales bacterium]|jgi:hypothetical protein|nr:hypothetical protein [Puniceicoccales bacterium]
MNSSHQRDEDSKIETLVTIGEEKHTFVKPFAVDDNAAYYRTRGEILPGLCFKSL